MSDFSQFKDIFNDSSSRIKKSETSRSNKRQSNQTIEKRNASKRKQNDGISQLLPSVFQWKKIQKLNTAITIPQSEKKSITDSVDKTDILPYLTTHDFDDCDLPDISCTENNDEQCVYSPLIEEFSEGDDLFLRSQEGELIAKLNEEINKIHQLKPKYKAVHQVKGGLLDKLRAMKSKRLALACQESKETRETQQKIRVINFSHFRRRLLVKFEFENETNSDLDAPPEHHFLVLSIEFEKLIKQHSFYDIICDLPRREFLKNHFIHFGVEIQASRAM